MVEVEVVGLAGKKGLPMVLMNGNHCGGGEGGERLACMVPMHVGGWLWGFYGDEQGVGMVGSRVCKVPRM